MGTPRGRILQVRVLRAQSGPRINSTVVDIFACETFPFPTLLPHD